MWAGTCLQAVLCPVLLPVPPPPSTCLSASPWSLFTLLPSGPRHRGAVVYHTVPQDSLLASLTVRIMLLGNDAFEPRDNGSHGENTFFLLDPLSWLICWGDSFLFLAVGSESPNPLRVREKGEGFPCTLPTSLSPVPPIPHTATAVSSLLCSCPKTITERNSLSADANTDQNDWAANRWIPMKLNFASSLPCAPEGCYLLTIMQIPCMYTVCL